MRVRIRIIAYIVVFIIAAVLTYILAISDITHEPATTSSMSSAGLPVVYMMTPKGTTYNYLHGYTCEMDHEALRSVITPIDESRELSLALRQYGCVVSGISYEVRDLTGEELIERTTIADYRAEKGTIPLNFRFRNLLELNKEYMLVIKVNSENYGNIDYYTRIVITDKMLIQEQLDYAMWFSGCTRSPENLSQISARLEIDRTADNTNLGYVTNHCKLNQMGYAGLAPRLSSPTYINVMEYDGVYASLALNYTIETGEDAKEDYRVWEYFRLNYVNETLTYVNTYQRFMDQQYHGVNGVGMNGEIYLGIRSEDEVPAICSGNGYWTAYVMDGNLWLYSAGKSTITKVFSFEDDATDGFREQYPEYGVQLLNLSNSGAVDFLVYGYMNRGPHEGEVGVSVCSYDYATETVKEHAFLDYDIPTVVLEQNVKKLSYLNAAGNLYFYRNHTIYYVNCTTRECMLVASDINEEEMYRLGPKLIFQKGSDSELNDCIYMLDLEEGNTVTIKGNADEYVKMLGFIDDNIVYGVSKKSDLNANEDGIVHPLMYSLILCDTDLNIVKNYARENVYITDVTFRDVKITLQRKQYDPETGAWKNIADDELLSNRKQGNALVELVTKEDDRRQLEYYLQPKVASYCKPKVRTSRYEFSSENSVFVSNTSEVADDTYKVYGSGKLLLATRNLAEAATLAYNTGGTVCDARNQLIWTRYKAKTMNITIAEKNRYLVRPAIEVPEGEEAPPADPADGMCDNSACAAINTMLNTAGYEVRIEDYMQQGSTWAERMKAACGSVYNLIGNTIDLSLFFTNQGVPLVVKTGADTYELVIAYNAKDVTLMNLTRGETRNVSLANMNKLLAAQDSVIYCVPKAE